MKTRNLLISSVTILLFLLLVLVLYVNRDLIMPGDRGETVLEDTVSVRPIGEGRPSAADESTGTMVKKKIMPPPPHSAGAPAGEKAEAAYKRLQEEVVLFFDYLDQQDYVREYHFPQGTYRHSLGLLSKLFARPPIVSGETKDLFVLAGNLAHFCRVIGKEDIAFVKDVLSQEEEIMESAMDLFFDWAMVQMNTGEGGLADSFEELYEYAAFFLNTLGGRSYLMRRDSKVRMLITYYAILIVDHAERKNLNHYGIALKPRIDLLMDDMSQFQGLEYRDRYLTVLRRIGKS
ncbi:MAG: hypothetical protein JXO48_09995 [Deltaproteobacteria bacterium]|nr:hypothetical protein [Deltaproteobacteria bacterium]